MDYESTALTAELQALMARMYHILRWLAEIVDSVGSGETGSFMPELCPN